MKDRGNLVAGDIILGIDGHEIDDISTLLATLENYQIGDRVKLRYLRENKENTISLILK
jgi:S1-C subfamily serine protease